MKINSYGIGNIENIKKIVEEFGINLPQDYKDFLLLHNGADIAEGIFYVKDLKEKILMGGFFGVKLDSDPNSVDLIYQNREYGDDIPENSLIIGSDPGSGWILLIFDGENDGIWYYDHSCFFEQSTDELNTYFICETFTEFLEMLKNTKL
jgi:hypothetical protein